MGVYIAGFPVCCGFGRILWKMKTYLWGLLTSILQHVCVCVLGCLRVIEDSGYIQKTASLINHSEPCSALSHYSPAAAC